MEKYYPYIQKMIHRLQLEHILDRDKETKKAVEILYRCQDKKKIWEEIWCQRIMLILAAVILSIRNYAGVVTFGVRAQSGEDRVEKELTVELKTEEEQGQSPEETPVPQAEVLMAEIQEKIQEAVEQQKDSEEILLPATVSGSRWEPLALDYPELINKVLLLLSAGLTVRGCFDRICGEYKNRLEQGGSRRYVYEEIRVSCQEMKNGVSEAEVIGALGDGADSCPILNLLLWSIRIYERDLKD